MRWKKSSAWWFVLPQIWQGTLWFDGEDAYFCLEKGAVGLKLWLNDHGRGKFWELNGGLCFGLNGREFGSCAMRAISLALGKITCWFNNDLWFSNSSRNTLKDNNLSRVAREKEVINELKERLRPLMMYEIYSSSSIILPATTNWLVYSLVVWRNSEHVLGPCFRICSCLFKCATCEREWLANWFASADQTSFDEFKLYTVERTLSKRETFIQRSISKSFLV